MTTANCKVINLVIGSRSRCFTVNYGAIYLLVEAKLIYSASRDDYSIRVTAQRKPSPIGVGEGGAGAVMAGESLLNRDPAGGWIMVGAQLMIVRRESLSLVGRHGLGK